MNVAYVERFHPQDIGAWSGTPYHMSNALKNQGIELTTISTLGHPYQNILKLRQFLSKKLPFPVYLWDRDPFVVKKFAHQALRKLENLTPSSQIVLASSSLPIAYLECSQPIVIWTDSTFAGMLDFYPEFSRLSASTIDCGQRHERLALHRSERLIFSSSWAAETAVKHYEVDPCKIHVVPFGANLTFSPLWNDIKTAISRRSSSCCQLLFLAVDWFRKGGDLALKIACYLNRAGLDTELLVVGCKPISKEPLPKFVNYVEFINKSNDRDIELLYQMLKESHLLILPTLADCTPVVFAEANAFGIPVLTTNIGGISTSIEDNVNGKMFPLDASEKDYGEFILQLFNDHPKYQAMCESSYLEYCNKLNWRVSGEHVKNILESLL